MNPIAKIIGVVNPIALQFISSISLDVKIVNSLLDSCFDLLIENIEVGPKNKFHIFHYNWSDFHKDIKKRIILCDLFDIFQVILVTAKFILPFFVVT